MKDLLNDVIAERHARLVLVRGAAGVGKSRLGWELEKYVEGIAGDVFWHRGWCLTFGEEVAFWALAEIVRGRLGLTEGEPPDTGRAKLAAELVGIVADEAEREYIAARLSRLLGVDTPEQARLDLSRDELFAGWRLFFERLAARGPVLLLFEDAQHADPGLLDFVDYLVDWVRGLPILVVVLARPELEERRPGFGVGASRRLIALDPLPRATMATLIMGLVEELPANAAEAIAAHAEGIPLFAVETVRSLIDQDVVVALDGVYTLVGEVASLSIPDSLHTLLTARLDALDDFSRSLMADAAVLGTSFSAEMIAGIAGADESKVREALDGLTQRDVLHVSADVLSPHLGAYSFSHGLTAQVAYDAMSASERKDRHLRVVGQLDSTRRNEGDTLAEVIARHYLDALSQVPDDDDTPQLRAAAADWLARAGRRARQAGSPSSAARSYAAAADLVEQSGDVTRAAVAADLSEQASAAYIEAAEGDEAVEHAERAAALYRRLDLPRDAARAITLAGQGHDMAGRSVQAREMLHAALDVLDESPDTDTLAALVALASLAVLRGDDEADGVSRRALELGQEMETNAVMMARLLNARGVVHVAMDRVEQAEAYYRQALLLSRSTGATVETARALVSLADVMSVADPAAAVELAREAQELARRIGARWLLVGAVATEVVATLATTDWDSAAASIDVAIAADGLGEISGVTAIGCIVWALRGDPARARMAFASLSPVDEGDDDPQENATRALAWTAIMISEGNTPGALASALDAVRHSRRLGLRSEAYRWAWPAAARAAHESGARETLDELIAMLEPHPPGHLASIVRAERGLAIARLVEDDAERYLALDVAVREVRNARSPWHLALALTDQADDLLRHGLAGEAAALIAEAGSIASALGSEPLMQRVMALRVRADPRPQAIQGQVPASRRGSAPSEPGRLPTEPPSPLV